MSGTDFSAWVGRQEAADDIVTPRLVRDFHATLDPHLANAASGVAPLLIHWCLAPPAVPLDQIGADGHPKKGGFLPPIPLPRRMWASGELTFLDDLHVGEPVHRTSSIASIQRKEGKTGELWFVNVAHEIANPRGVAIREVQTLVYRGAETGQRAGPEATLKAENADSIESVDTSTVRLFRYSALTFNGHRIHYDAPYARDVEHYSGLVVHGPLQATLLAHLASRLKGVGPAQFRYRGVSALVAGEPLSIRARAGESGIECCACDANGRLTMEARATG